MTRREIYSAKELGSELALKDPEEVKAFFAWYCRQVKK